MPVSYAIDAERHLIRTVCTRDTTLLEVIGHFRELEALPSLPTPLHVYLDLTEIESLPDLRKLLSVADATGSLVPTVRWGALAIVASADVVFGVGRMYQALVERYFERVMVFRDAAEAEVWLDNG